MPLLDDVFKSLSQKAMSSLFRVPYAIGLPWRTTLHAIQIHVKSCIYS